MEPEIPIGGIGHRSLAAPDLVARGVDAALDLVAATRPGRRLTVLTALAEGADRIVAERALARPDAGFVVVLPMPESEYLAGFTSAASRREYRALERRARATIRLLPPEPPIAAFAALGRWLVDHSEVLLAVWDGEPARGPGGTAEVVGLAIDAGLPVLRVRPGEGGLEIHDPPGGFTPGGFDSPLVRRYLDALRATEPEGDERPLVNRARILGLAPTAIATVASGEGPGEERASRSMEALDTLTRLVRETPGASRVAARLAIDAALLHAVGRDDEAGSFLALAARRAAADGNARLLAWISTTREWMGV